MLITFLVLIIFYFIIIIIFSFRFQIILQIVPVLWKNTNLTPLSHSAAHCHTCRHMQMPHVIQIKIIKNQTLQVFLKNYEVALQPPWHVWGWFDQPLPFWPLGVVRLPLARPQGVAEATPSFPKKKKKNCRVYFLFYFLAIS
jgi:hypothetical protein